MRPRKGFLLLSALACAGGLFVLWGQPWFEFGVALPSTAEPTLSVSGSVVAPVLSGLIFASIATVAVLSLTTGIFAYLLITALAGTVLGMLLTLLGSLSNPLAASVPRFTQVTGLVSEREIATYVSSLAVLPALIIFLILLALLLVVSIALAWNARSWSPTRYAKYARRQEQHSEQGGIDRSNDAIGSWDDLSSGIDPTTR